MDRFIAFMNGTGFKYAVNISFAPDSYDGKAMVISVDMAWFDGEDVNLEAMMTAETIY